MIGKLFRAVLGVLVATFVVVTLAYADDAITENAAAEADPNDPSNNDPLEDINRAIFEINGVLYEVTTPFVELTRVRSAACSRRSGRPSTHLSTW